MNIHDTIIVLKSAASFHHADLDLLVKPLGWGTALAVIWDSASGTGGDAVDDQPREAFLHFRPDTGEFTFAHVSDNRRFANCLEEGLSEQIAIEESQQRVETFADVERYLLRRPYRKVLTTDPN